MQTSHEIGSLVLYQGDATAKAFYKSEASYAELLAMNDSKMILNLLPLNTLVVVPKETVCPTTVDSGKKGELEYLLGFFRQTSKQLYGSIPPIRLQKKCLRALIQSFELMENKLTREQALKIVMTLLRSN